MKFDSEMEMSKHFEAFIVESSINENVELLSEVKGLFGIPDYVMVEKKSSIHTMPTVIVQVCNRHSGMEAIGKKWGQGRQVEEG